MTAGWQVIVYGLAMVLFLAAAFVAAVKHWGWPILVALGLALVVLVPLWNANAIYD